MPLSLRDPNAKAIVAWRCPSPGLTRGYELCFWSCFAAELDDGLFDKGPTPMSMSVVEECVYSQNQISTHV